VLIANRGLLDRESVLVGAGRGLPRRVGGHASNDNPMGDNTSSLSTYLARAFENLHGSQSRVEWVDACKMGMWDTGDSGI
jgi:hypothetical protein